jgi:hypothetical protein
MKRWILSAGLVCSVAYAGAIKTWVGTEPIISGDLNTALSHIHNVAEAQITDAKISSSAAISHSKLAIPSLIPKAWVYIYSATPCAGASSATCTILASSGVTSVVGAATAGLYNVTLSSARANPEYGVIVTSHTSGVVCTTVAPPTSTTVFQVQCISVSGASATDANFTALMLDN